VLRPIKAAGVGGAPGVIDTFTAGVLPGNRIPWIIGIPIFLDLVLYLAPRLSGAPVFHRLAKRVMDVYGSMAATGMDQATVDFMRERVAEFDTAASSFNLFFLIPASLAQIPSIQPSSLTGTFSLELNSGLSVLSISLAFILVGTFLGCLFLGVLAQQVRDGKISPTVLIKRVEVYFVSVLGFVLLLIGMFVAISIPVGIVFAVISLISAGIATALLSAMGALAQVFGILVLIYLFFWIDAIVVSDAGPMRAAVNSARVVASNFWSSVFFMALIEVITLGTFEIWSQIVGTPLGTIVAIIGNAYIATGLAAAAMLFYQTRVSRLPAARGVLGRVSQA